MTATRLPRQVARAPSGPNGRPRPGRSPRPGISGTRGRLSCPTAVTTTSNRSTPFGVTTSQPVPSWASSVTSVPNRGRTPCLAAIISR